mmetsp:Transcript_8549/g.14712  ORF Transcript_8549/g.14712 Transcript_8549/m.14712 type:complete len:209 (-) Transcript_8549:444-1070(-)
MGVCADRRGGAGGIGVLGSAGGCDGAVLFLHAPRDQSRGHCGRQLVRERRWRRDMSGDGEGEFCVEGIEHGGVGVAHKLDMLPAGKRAALARGASVVQGPEAALQGRVKRCRHVGIYLRRRPRVQVLDEDVEGGLQRHVEGHWVDGDASEPRQQVLWEGKERHHWQQRPALAHGGFDPGVEVSAVGYVLRHNGHQGVTLAHNLLSVGR